MTLSYHCWVYDTDTKKVIDPHFRYYDFVKEVRNLKGNAFYNAFPKQQRKKLVKELEFQERAEKVRDMYINNRKEYNQFKSAVFQANNCANNCLFTYVENGGGKNLKFVVGRMGWKQQNGEVFWEYE